MTAILMAAEMRALEQEAIGRGEVTGLELMERAGRGVVEAIRAEWPEIEPGARRAVVLCGPGNNGGDGFVVARLLRARSWEVEVFFYGDVEKLPPDAKANYRRWSQLGETHPLDGSAARAFSIWTDRTRPALVIDAIFGIGLTRPVATRLGNIFKDTNTGLFDNCEEPGRIVALDLPSGLDADSGRLLFESGPHVVGSELHGSPEPLQLRPFEPLHAHLTVTFAALKPGHLMGKGPSYCGKTRVVDIGLDPWRQRRRLAQVQPFEKAMGRPFPDGRLVQKRTGHKYTHGHALLLSGGCGKGGAARLAARGSLRIGAGLVTLAVPPAALQENAARLDAIMLRSVRDVEAVANLLSDPRYNALLAGPGLGTSEREAALLHTLLDASRGAGQGAAKPVPGTATELAPTSQPGAWPATIESGVAAPPTGLSGTRRAVVLDADALTVLAKDETLRAKLHDRCILTPHDGEFARLFPAIEERLNTPATTGPAYSKVDAARDAAREAGCVVLLKGPDTVIADPTGRVAINAAVYERAAPWLATAGSGDVLAGMICGLIARGFAPFEAACTAAWLHVEAARSFGPGLIAEDLPEELSKVFRSIGL